MKTVALLDHYSGGHHLAFIRLFAKYLLKLGCRVCIFFPDREKEIRNYLVNEGFDDGMFFFHPSTIIKKKINFPGRLSDPLTTLLFWWKTKRMLQAAEKKLNIKFTSVYFAWLDDYLSNDLPHQIIDFIFPIKWSGLLFHPNFLRQENLGTRISFSSVDSVLLAHQCLSVAVHDESLIKKLQVRIKKSVILFPEMADTTKPKKTALANEVITKASGRIIVGLIGMEKRKGVLHFINLMKVADPEKFFFFLAGRPSANDYGPDEFERVSHFIQTRKENLFFHDGYIEEGEAINSVICTFHILFLVYHDFKSSSNFMTKAVYFNQLVLASNRFWIGETTKKFNTGLVAEEGNTEQAYDALNELRRHIQSSSWNFSLYPAYLKIHEEQALEKAFRESLIVE